jgi:hypothetical protein
VLNARRVSIIAVLALGYLYYRVTGGSAALASIGLIAFVGMAQVLPAMLGGLFWRGANRVGAAAGLLVGFAIWLYALFLPSFGPDVLIPARVLAEGPFGIGWLRPQALFGSQGMDPLLHALFWSLALNATAFCLGSRAGFSQPAGACAGRAVRQCLRHPGRYPRLEPGRRRGRGPAGHGAAHPWRGRGAGFLPRRGRGPGQGRLSARPHARFLERLERRLAGSVGAATAHAMVAQSVGGSTVSVEDLMAVANETAQIMEYSSQLEAKSAELERTARQLREANDMLTKLSVQKDAFLSQISHELRTPMTSIRAFSEILKEGSDLNDAEQRKYAGHHPGGGDPPDPAA